QKPVKAYEMIDVLRETGVGAAKPATVYRALDYLAGHGLVHKIHSLNAYVPCQDPARSEDCQLLICDQCEKVLEFCDARWPG
ncbi:MAG: transcriptional repressor, partial [Myxococcota bacterium]